MSALAWRGFASASLSTLLALQLCGCVNPADRAAHFAGRHQLSGAVIEGAGYRHEIFTRSSSPPGVLYVFIDGDGSPWVRGGMQVASDPTPASTLALELATQTPHSVLYLGRPCYFHVRRDSGCSPEVWTSARYSDRVVESMAAAINRYTAASGFFELVLIGYSGGGTLAVLIAPRVPATRAVVTIAANLDVAAWVRRHGYLPLDESLDPSTQPPLPDSLPQWHLVAGHDRNVPAHISRSYLERIPPERIWRYADFDHTCCWVEQWHEIFARLEIALRDTGSIH